jgi:hypothetical protein
MQVDARAAYAKRTGRVSNSTAPTVNGDFNMNKQNGAENAVEQQVGLDVVVATS